MVGATFFALFIGNLSSILINVDVAQKKYAEILNQVSNFEFPVYIPRIQTYSRFHVLTFFKCRSLNTCDTNKYRRSCKTE